VQLLLIPPSVATSAYPSIGVAGPMEGVAVAVATAVAGEGLLNYPP